MRAAYQQQQILQEVSEMQLLVATQRRPVRVRDQQIERDRFPFEFPRQRLSQPANAGARIKNYNFTIDPEFHARSIAAIANRFRARRVCGIFGQNSLRPGGRQRFDDQKRPDAYATLFETIAGKNN